MNAADAIEFMLAGAAAVAVGTSNFINPAASLNIIEGIGAFMKEHAIENVAELTGGLRV